MSPNSLSMPITVQQDLLCSLQVKLLSFSGADSTEIPHLLIMLLLRASRSCRKFLRWVILPLAMASPEMWQRSFLMILAMRSMTPCIFWPVVRAWFSLSLKRWMIVSGKMILQIQKQICSFFKIQISSIHRRMPTFWKMLIAMLMMSDSRDPSIPYAIYFYSQIILQRRPYTSSQRISLSTTWPFLLNWRTIFEFFEGGSALGAFRVYLGPILDALPMEKMLARSVDIMKSVFVASEANRAHFLSLSIFRDVIELVAFSSLVYIVKNRILIIERLQKGNLPLRLLPLSNEPLLDSEPSQSQQVVLPRDISVEALDEQQQGSNEVQDKYHADRERQTECFDQIAVDRVKLRPCPENESHQEVGYLYCRHDSNEAFDSAVVKNDVDLRHAETKKVLNALPQIEDREEAEKTHGAEVAHHDEAQYETDKCQG